MKDVRKVKHPSEEELLLYHYAEAGGPPRAAVTEHMAVCEPCRTRYRILQAVLAAADVVEAPARSEDFEDEVWRRLVPRLEAGESLWQRFFAGSGARRLWAPVGAVVAVAVLVVGHFWPDASGRADPSPSVRLRSSRSPPSRGSASC